jgi:RNA polymerase sigma factor (TIGR02999 family)
VAPRVESSERGPAADPGAFTTSLAAARAGDRTAFDRVFTLAYEELRRVASRQATRFAGDTSLSTTALVHETYLKLAGDNRLAPNDRTHFFALAARAMRQVLIDRVRHGDRKKRGGGVPDIPLEGLVEVPGASDAGAPGAEDLLALDRALRRLSAVDPELGQLVEWRFFAGLTLDEISVLTGVSERTLKRDWAVARVFLLRELAGPPPPPAS